MEYTALGRSAIQVSRIAFGCEPLGGTDWGAFDESQALDAVRAAVDAGVTLFDVADIYGLGRAEEVLGRALGDRRHDVHIATKVGVRWEPGAAGSRARTFRDASPAWVEHAIEASLRRLGVERIALYQLHWPDPATPIESTIEALARVRDRGLIEVIGVSNVTADELRRAQSVARVEAIQCAYNLGDRAVEDDVLPCAKNFGMGVLAYGPLAQGLLTGKFATDARFGEDDRRHRLAQFQGAERDRYLRLADRLGTVGGRHGRTAAQTAIRWLLDRGPQVVAIVGAKQPAQLQENVGATGWSLSRADLAYLEEAV